MIPAAGRVSFPDVTSTSTVMETGAQKCLL